ncbi:hypothetical protein AB0N38_26115 [Micromonospora aurantiaca]|uniref:hypothetical protein n=1 Tax=Micromonospora aurantiaca (nom. illeg.) TaxID=47850 RepID=UPI0034126C16
MGLDVLFWIVVLTWMAKRGAEDVTHALRGTTPPRHRERMERIKRGESQSRYGMRGWLDDATEDFLRANTQWRRSRSARKAAARLNVPIDDMVEVVREPRRDRNPTDPNNTRDCTTCGGSVVLDGRPCPRCLAEQQRRNAEWEAEHGRWDARRKPGEPEWLTPGFDEVAFLAEGARKCPRCQVGLLAEMSDGSTRCPNCEPFDVAREAPEFMRATETRGRCPDCGAPNPFGTPCQQHNPPSDDDTPTARIYQFPNINQFEKEITMANTEVTSLATAMAYAELASKAHESFATAGAEPYVANLENAGMTGEAVGSARAAAEASANAAAMWEAHRALLEQQMQVKEAYQSQPDAANKEFLLNG